MDPASGAFRLSRTFSQALAAFRLRWAPMLVATLLLGYLPAAAPFWFHKPGDEMVSVHVDLPPQARSSDRTSHATAGAGHLQHAEMFLDTTPVLVWLPLQLLCAVAMAGALASLTVSAAERERQPWREATRDAVVNLPALIAINLAAAAAILIGSVVIVPGLSVMAAWAVATPVQVIEHAGILGSLRRSRTLTRGHRLSLLGMLALWFAAYLAIQLIAFNVLLALGFPALPSLILQPIPATLASLAFDVLTAAAYLELRRVKEGVAVGELEAVFA